MKKYTDLKKRPLPYHKERGLGESITAQAKEEGRSGFLYRTKYFISKIFNYHFQLLAKSIAFSGFRIKLQRARGVKIGENVHIGPNVSIDEIYPNYVVIGNGSSLAGHNIVLTHYKPLEYHKNISESFVAPTIIEDNVVIANGTIILAGVTVGEGAIVGAGSVVTKDIPPMVLAVGVPAKPVKDYADKLKDNYTEEEFAELMKKRKEMGFSGIK